MERFGKVPTRAALLALLAVTCAVAHAESEAPPPRSARLGLAIASLDDSWRESNAYRASGLMVVGVDPRGRAARSGIVAGDVLVSVGSRTMHEPSDLGHAERTLSPDQAVSIVLARDGGRMIKVFEIAPVGAVPPLAEAPATASAPPTVAPSSEPAPLAAVAATGAASDTASPPAVVAAPANTSDTASPPAVVAAPANTSDTASPPAAVTPASAAADTASVPAASGTSVVDPGQAASLKAASDAGSVTATGTAGVPAAAGGSASAPVALSASAAIVAVPVAAAVGGSEGSPATTTATVDSGGTLPESAEPDAAVLGVIGKSLTPDLATALGATGVEGVLVLDLDAASPADRSGIRAGDIILKVGSQPVADVGEFQRAAAASASPVQVSTLRLGKSQVVLVALDGPPPVPVAAPSQEQLLTELRDEVRSLRREVQSLRKKLGK